MKRQTVRYARSHLDRWSASRILCPSVPFNARLSIPWIKAPRGGFAPPTLRAGYVGRRSTR